jgi:hypothetical protein
VEIMADELLTLEDFAPHVGKIALFRGTDFAFPIDRVQGEGGKPPPGWMRVPFIVIFAGPRGPNVMPEGMYTCQVEGGPAWDLYVIPVHTPRSDRQEYQAAFN